MTSWLKRDALNRAWRAVLQGIAAIVVVPAADAAVQVLQRDMLGMFAGQPFDWRRTAITAGVSAATAATVAVAAYVHRLKLDPSRLPSAQPPRPPGVSEYQAPATEPTPMPFRGPTPTYYTGDLVPPQRATSRNRWRIGFLAVTVLAIVMELIAALDGNSNTDPWTDLVVAYVPVEVAVAVFGALVAWLPVHLGIRYARRRRESDRT